MPIMLAPMSIEKPMAIEKKAVIEEKSRMRGEGFRNTIPHGPDPAKELSLSFTRPAGSQSSQRCWILSEQKHGLKRIAK